MKKEFIVCLALSTVLSTVSFADLSRVENDENSKIYQQNYTYTSSSRQATYLSLPAYPINLNGEMIDNAHLEYPFLTYKGITYMPLTYNLTRCLGIETSWTAETGLKVDVTNVSSEYNPQLKKRQNAKRVKAQAPQYQVLVNDTPLSGDDTYPCFVYNNIVYLPLTTELAENELNLSLQYDTKMGLAINALNPHVKAYKKISQNFSDEDWQKYVKVYKDNIYYIDNQDRVMVQSVDLSVEPKAFKALNDEISSFPDNHFFSQFEVKDESVLLTCHVGGAMMGSDLVYKLFEDGTYTLISSSYDIVEQFEDFDIRYWGGPMGGGSLYIRYKSDEEAKPNVNAIETEDNQYERVGAEDVRFGWYWYEKDGSAGGSPSGPVILRGDNLYLLGYDSVNDDHTSIFNVNYKTNETKALIGRDVNTFTSSGDDLYYKSPSSELTDAIYRYNIKTQKDELIYQSDGYILTYAFLGEHLYFMDDKRQFKMVLDENTSQPVPSTESTSCEGLKLFDDEETYLVSTFKETADSKYRIIVLNEAEEIIFKTSDYANLGSISIDDDVLYYVNDASGDLCSASLKGVQ